MARPVAPLIVVALFMIALFAVVPAAEASHAHGHRFMIHGQIVDAEGKPAQHMPVTLSATAAVEPHPQMTLDTDCYGFFYSQQTQPRVYDTGLDDGRLHLHPSFPNDRSAEWRRPDPEFFISTPYADYREDALTPQTPISEDDLRAYAVHVGRADHRELQAVHANVRLEDAVLEPHPECEEVDWTRAFIVRGKVQVIDGRHREDQVSIFHEGQYVVGPEQVTVTIHTPDGRETQTVTTDRAAMYTALFTNITVEPGSRITVEWDGNEREGRVPEGYHSAGLDIVTRDWFWQSTGFVIGAGVVVGAGVLVAATWGGMQLKDKLETKKAMERSTRKRANK